MKKDSLLLNELVVALDSVGLDWRQIMEDHITKKELQFGISRKETYNLAFLRIVMWKYEIDHDFLTFRNLVEEYSSI
jgi:hypothetical protein